LLIVADTTNPPRRLAGYALTTANDEPSRDPRDWKLLGSERRREDMGNVLDVRVNQRFTERFQRRVFQLTNAAACRLYRLQVDSVVQPDNMIQIGEVEPLYEDAAANSQLFAGGRGQRRQSALGIGRNGLRRRSQDQMAHL
jgi:hypothetical protein